MTNDLFASRQTSQRPRSLSMCRGCLETVKGRHKRSLVLHEPRDWQTEKNSMTQRCEIPIPISANDMHRLVWPKKPNSRPFPVNTTEYEAWLKHAGYLVKTSMSPVKTLPIRVRLEVYGGEGFTKARDLDNCWKPLLDMLRKAGILPNDRVGEVASLVGDYFPPTAKGVKAKCFVEVEELTDRAVRGIQGELFGESEA